MIKKRRVVVEVTTDETVTVEALKANLTFHLRRTIGDQDISYKKGTLPDPDTVRRGNIYYNHAIVLQETGGRVPKPKVNVIDKPKDA